MRLATSTAPRARAAPAPAVASSRWSAAGPCSSLTPSATRPSCIASRGAYPVVRLVRDAAGNLYGTTLEAGSCTCTGRNQVLVGCGTVFKLDPDGNETVLYTFTGGSDGAFSYAGR